MIDLCDWIGVISTLGGVFVGGVIALIVSKFQYKQQRVLEYHKRQIANFENIHEHLSMMQYQSGILMSQVVGHIGMGIPYNADSLGKSPISKLTMLVDFYTPSLKPEVDIISKHFIDLWTVAVEGVAKAQDSRAEDWKGQAILKAYAAMEEIGKTSLAAKEKLTLLIQPFVSLT